MHDTSIPFKASISLLHLFPTHLELLDSLVQLFGAFVCEVSLQVVFLSLVDPLLHLVHLLPQSHGLIETTFKSRLLGIGLQERTGSEEHAHTHTHTHTHTQTHTQELDEVACTPACRCSPTDCWVRPVISGCRWQTVAQPRSSGTGPPRWCRWRWAGWCGCHLPGPGKSECRSQLNSNLTVPDRLVFCFFSSHSFVSIRVVQNRFLVILWTPKVILWILLGVFIQTAFYFYLLCMDSW